jgi:23S rRNA pseudouridine2605 synthase
MRINKFVALATGMSRRTADRVISSGNVLVNGSVPNTGYSVVATDTVTLDGKIITPPVSTTTIMLNKPPGYVCSRDGQGSRTVYELLPTEYHRLKSIGRLDKNSSGLLLLTDDGDLANNLTHPSKAKQKIYEVSLNQFLTPLHRQMIQDIGITLEDGVSKFSVERMHEGDDRIWKITMSEGRNRQIRRTFEALGYTVIRLHRTHFGNYVLGDLAQAKYETLL